MQFWIEYVVENQTAKELIDTLEDETFDDVVCMTLLDATGDEAAQISEIELEEILIAALEILLKGREISSDSLLNICTKYSTNPYELIDEGIILEWEGNFYEGEE